MPSALRSPAPALVRPGGTARVMWGPGLDGWRRLARPPQAPGQRDHQGLDVAEVRAVRSVADHHVGAVALPPAQGDQPVRLAPVDCGLIPRTSTDATARVPGRRSQVSSRAGGTAATVTWLAGPSRSGPSFAILGTRASLGLGRPTGTGSYSRCHSAPPLPGSVCWTQPNGSQSEISGPSATGLGCPVAPSTTGRPLSSSGSGTTTFQVRPILAPAWS
jgi:hypothetical protein